MSPYRVRDAAPDELAPVVSWDDFLTYVFRWKQNQHIGLVGPTEQGKTNLGYHLLELRKFVTYFAIKPYDETLEAFCDSGHYTRLYTWPPEQKRFLRPKRLITPQEMPRRMLWPDATALDSEEEQERVFSRALSDIYADGGWCTVLDDYWYMANILGFEKQTKKFLANARSNYIPMVIAVQRPSGNRLVEIFDQTTHLFFFRDNDETNLQRIGGVGWLAAQPIRAFVARLERFQFLYVNTRTGWMFRSSAPELKPGRRNDGRSRRGDRGRGRAGASGPVRGAERGAAAPAPGTRGGRAPAPVQRVRGAAAVLLRPGVP